MLTLDCRFTRSCEITISTKENEADASRDRGGEEGRGGPNTFGTGSFI